MKRYIILLFATLISLTGLLGFSGFVQKADAAYLNITGFETGDTLELNNVSGTYSIQSTTKRTGGYALRTNPTGNNTAVVAIYGLSSAGQATNLDKSTIYVTAYIKVAAHTMTAGRYERIVGFRDSSGNLKAELWISQQSWGTIFHNPYGGGSSQFVTYGWQRLDFEVGTGTNAYINIKLDGVTIANANTNLGTGNHAYLEIGRLTGNYSDSWDIYWDDIAISDSAVPGAGKVNILKPNAAGGNQSFGGSYTSIDDVPHDGDTTILYAGGGQSDWNLEDSSTGGVAGNIGAVKAVAILKAPSTDANFKVYQVNGVYYTYTDAATHNWFAPYKLYAYVRSTHPSGSTWTTSNLDSLWIGLQHVSGGSIYLTAQNAMVWNTGSYADVATTGVAGYSYNYITAAGTLNNQTGNTVWYGARWGAGTGYSTTACQDLPYQQLYSTAANGFNGSVQPQFSGLTAGTLYYFCVYAHDQTAGQYYYSPTTSSYSTSAAQVPTMERVTKGEITTTTANITGNVAAENGASITAKGVCYSSTNTSPAVGQGGTTCTSNGTGTAAYTANITGLTANTLYYFRSYATNSAGSGYSGVVDTFTTETTPPAGSPQIVSTTGLYDRVNTTTHNVVMPAVVDANDLLIVITANDGSATVTTPSGWTQLFTTANSTSLRLGAYYKFAAGTEDGTSVNFATSASEILTAQVYRITGALAVESGTAATGTSTTPNPPSLIPSWGARDTLWLSALGADDGSITVSTYPTNYTNGRLDKDTYSSSITYASVASARRYLNASSEDPGTFTLTGSNAWVANTIAIRPEPSTPTITSPTKTNVTYNNATLGGNITNQGASAVDIRGVCYSVTTTNASPEHGGTGVICTNNASGGTGIFTVNVTSLEPETGYSYKAFGHNTQGYAYTSADTFTTLTNAPTGVTTNAETNLNSYKVTFNGTANPNGSQAYGYFRYFTSAPNCTVDSGGYRVPSDSSQDYDLGNGSSPVNYSITSSSAVPLTPNTNYWYCAYSRNVAAGEGSPGTAAAAGYDTFTTPDGQVSACDAPATGNLAISEQCSFPASDYDGVDSGTGTDNGARITLSSGGRLAILPGQRIGRGSIVFSGGSLILVNGGASMIRGGVWLKDSDGDGYLDQPIQKIVSATQPAGYVRRNQAYQQPHYNTTTFQYASDFYNAATTAPTYLDCDETNGNIFQDVASLVVDSDNDGYKTSAGAATQCVGDTSTVNARTYYRDGSGSYTYLPSVSALGSGATDCQDDPNGAPCPPSSVTASNPSSQTQNNISWSGTDTGGAVPAATGYDIEWCTGTSCTPPASGTLTNVTSTYAHTGRSASTTYGYRVVAKNANGSGTPSSPVRYATTQAACTNGYRDLDGDGVGGDYGCWTGTVVNTQAPVAKLAPATVANDNSIGTVAWSGTVANLAAANDSSVANLTGGGGSAISNYLKITNWGFSIPSGASIVGVIADVRAYHSTCCGYQSSLYSVKLVKGGTVTGSEGKSTSTLPASPAYTAHGAVNSLWGTSLTPADVNSTGFGIAIAFQAAAQFNPGYGSLDHIRLKVFYAGGSPAPSGDYNDSDSSCYVNLGTMYPDNDGDGYTIGSVSNVCIGGASTTGNVGRLSAPSGQSDCYDGNANAKPGQTGYFDQPRGDGHPTLSYDYDCNNGVEIEQASYACCTENNGWITGGVYSGDQFCGGNSSINGACWAADVVSEFTCNSNASYCGKRRVSGGYVYGHSGWVCTSTIGNCSFSGCNTAISLKVENPYYVNCK